MSQKKAREKRKLNKAIQQTLKARTYQILSETLKAEHLDFDKLDPIKKLALATLAKKQAEKDLERVLKLQKELDVLKTEEAKK